MKFKISQNKYCYKILLLYQNKVVIYTEPSFWMSTVEISIVLENMEILTNSWCIFLYGSTDSCLEWAFFSFFFALAAQVLTEAFTVHIYQVHKKSLHAFCTLLTLLVISYFLRPFQFGLIIYFYFYVYIILHTVERIGILEAK